MELHPKLFGLSNEEVVTVNTNPFSIGRALSCNFVITSKLVSRVHCTLHHTEDGWHLKDSSTNGTHVNGALIKGTASEVLKTGDHIMLSAAPVGYRFEIPPPPIEQPEPGVLSNEEENEQLAQLVDSMESNEAPKEEGDKPSAGSKRPAEDVEAAPKKSKTELAPQEDNMEENLTCSICTEMFIKAVTLTCSHSFCRYCLETWQKTRRCCPICRAACTQAYPSLALDNVIASMVNGYPEEERKRRQQVVEDRRQQEAPAAAGIKPPETHRRQYDEDDEEDDEEDLDEDAYDADSVLLSDFDSSNDGDESEWETRGRGRRVYYGGYGLCFVCGDPGHWANSCPNR